MILIFMKGSIIPFYKYIYKYISVLYIYGSSGERRQI